MLKYPGLSAALLLALAFSFLMSSDPTDDSDIRYLDLQTDRYPGSVRPSVSHCRLNINAAGLDAFQTLPGIGPRLAERILVYRQVHGDFKVPEELSLVTGISRTMVDRYRALLCV